MQAALELDQLDKAEELLAIVEGLAPGLRPQFLNGQLARFRAQFAARRGNVDDVDDLFRGACGLFQQLARDSNTPNGSPRKSAPRRRSPRWPNRVRPSSGSARSRGSNGSGNRPPWGARPRS